MRLLFVLLVFINLQSFSQSILRGRITDSTKRSGVEGAYIHFLKNDTVIVSGARGSYRIELKRYLSDSIVVTHWKLGTVITNIAMEYHDLKELDIAFPVSCKSLPKTDICPKCGTSVNSVRIIYGYPSKEMFEKSERGEIRLGGCVVNDCMPHYYCRTDKTEY